jgi:phosphonatase-like hydrolase
MKPKLVIFDMAGTTIDDSNLVQQVAINTVKHFLGITISKTAADMVMGIPKKTAFITLCKDHSLEVSEDTIDEMVHYFNSELITQYANPNNVRLMPHAEELFNIIKKNNAFIYLNTGFERKIADVISQTLQLNLIIDGIVASDEVEHGRPEPDMILLAMQNCKVSDAREVMKIGDTISDLYEGYNAGCGWNIGVLTGAQSKEVLMTGPHTSIINDLSVVQSYFYD